MIIDEACGPGARRGAAGPRLRLQDDLAAIRRASCNHSRASAATAAAYQQVITAYGLHAIDFDLEEPRSTTPRSSSGELGAARILQWSRTWLADHDAIYDHRCQLFRQLLLTRPRAGLHAERHTFMPVDGGFSGGSSQVTAHALAGVTKGEYPLAKNDHKPTPQRVSGTRSRYSCLGCFRSRIPRPRSRCGPQADSSLGPPVQTKLSAESRHVHRAGKGSIAVTTTIHSTWPKSHGHSSVNGQCASEAWPGNLPAGSAGDLR